MLHEFFLAVAQDGPIDRRDQNQHADKEKRKDVGCRSVQCQHKHCKGCENQHDEAQGGDSVFVSQLIGRLESDGPAIDPRHDVIAPAGKTEKVVGENDLRALAFDPVTADHLKVAPDKFKKFFPFTARNGGIATQLDFEWIDHD